MMGQFAQDRHRPPGEWVQTTLVESVVGIPFRRADAMAFAAAAAEAESAGWRYGVELQSQPWNKADPRAIAVMGYVERKRWLGGTKISRWHVGFLSRDLAADITADLIANDIRIAAELYRIYEGNDDYLDIKIIVLAPPGHGHKERLKRRQA